MFWWIVGFASGIAAFGGWRMVMQKKDSAANGQEPSISEKSKDWTEVTETMESLIMKRMERRLAGMEEKLDVVMSSLAGSNAVSAGVSLNPSAKERDKPVADQYQTQLEQIVRLAERGTTLEDIAKKMKMHKGEVQLLLNLSKKSG
ncbi:MAG: hypothetical protein GT601_18080 [Acidaminobacter sp.]|uniref:DUF6115 domain-containing protein n=1 Tax=Acidaminobacter sp. TaxID=1872102 RepID=UPI00137CB16A|nr:hypothetical protein [Acidaminobacter sp.]MZQ99580.1 hypothetical protein [Acidaminobacter sp.]